MTFDEFLETLPNGLHDAELTELRVSFTSRNLVLSLNVDVTEGDEALQYRRLELTVGAVAFLVLDPPYEGYPFAKAKPLWIDAGSGEPSTSPLPLPTLPEGATLSWIFVNEWNAFIRFAAGPCRYEWVGEPRSLGEG